VFFSESVILTTHNYFRKMALVPATVPKITYSKISNSTRNLIITCLEENRGTMKEVARIYGISYSTIWRIWDRYEKTGDIDIRKRGGFRKKK